MARSNDSTHRHAIRLFAYLHYAGLCFAGTFTLCLMARALNRIKFSVVQAEPLGVRAWDAAAMLAISEESFERCRRAGWIKPAVESHALVIYDCEDVKTLWTRIKKEGGLPKRAQS